MVNNILDIEIDYLSGKIDRDTWEKRIEEAFEQAVMEEVEKRLNDIRNGT